MNGYQAFPISNFRTGFSEEVEPWLLPRDAYQVMINAHLYRGILEKIPGYTLFAKMSYRTMIDMTSGSGPDGVKTSYSFTLPSAPVTTQFLGYATIALGTAEKFTYASDGTYPIINLTGTAGGTGTINLTTLLVTLNPFNVVPAYSSHKYSCVFFQYDTLPGTAQPIMGIKPYYNINGSQDVMVFDTRRMGLIETNLGIIAATYSPGQVVVEQPHDYYQAAVFTGNAMADNVYTGTLTATLFSPFTVNIIRYYNSTYTPTATTYIGEVLNTYTDNGFGGFNTAGTTIDGTASFINYVTGDYALKLLETVPSTESFSFTVGIFGNFFTGDFSNFFVVSNFQFYAFITNNVDPIVYYDGFSIKYLDTNLETGVVTASMGVPAYDIKRCLHVFTNRDRLLLISCMVDGINRQNYIYWSADNQPLVFTNNEFEGAPTSEPIRTIGFINSDLIVRFANSEYVFRFTDDTFAPFRFDATNSLWACDASYSAINYDKWFSSVGRPAIVGSDGVNVKRVDERIIDFTDPYRLAQEVPVPFMNQTSIQQCYGERFDDLKEGWLCYNSLPLAQTNVQPSDHVLAYNYLDQTYAVYTFPFSCLGLGRIVNVPTWGTIKTTWGDIEDTWGSYELQSNALLDLAGDQFGKVYNLNSGNTLGDGTTPVLMSVITKNFNPFIEDGQLCRLGYVDLFVSADPQTILRVQFYVNDQLYTDPSGQPAGYYQETILTFNNTDAMSPTTTQTKVWKRIYVGAVGKEHTIRFYQADFVGTTLNQPVYIHAMVLYMKPAGRIFQ